MNLFQRLDDHSEFRPDIDVFHMGELDHTGLVNDDDGPVCRAVTAQNPICVTDFTMGPEIGNHLKPQIPHLPGPGIQRGNIVYTDAHKGLTPNRINRLRVESIFTAAMGYLPEKRQSWV